MKRIDNEDLILTRKGTRLEIRRHNRKLTKDRCHNDRKKFCPQRSVNTWSGPKEEVVAVSCE